MSRRWWNDSAYQAELTSRCESGAWLIVADKIPGKVIKIVYAGYKIQLPDNSTTIVNPDSLKDLLRDVSAEEYPVYEQAWLEEKADADRKRQEIEAIRLAKVQAQLACLHVSTETYNSCSAAGCDIYDTYCKECDKVLRRSWATAYDRDPDDHVSDWGWWVREHVRLYQQEPRRENYNVVEAIDDYLPAHHCKPRP
jgi:hypothetical protein